MKNIFEEYCTRFALNLEQFTQVDLSQFTKKRTYQCAFAKDKNNHNFFLILCLAKSRFISKDALFVSDLAHHFYQQGEKIIFLGSALCSKAEKLLKEKGFKYYALV
ncbi:tram-like protein [Campylobacter sp. MIT 99-7217]|uniref:tram-like protein n=1 Tax=Campylobacter sp. MIT 99-7217 TaxID=535091 RepID=UPI00115A817B|nr:tram-like protein [Campylobacter sp. MIT 99-7217]TQR33098.1 tram-like protein [Campylobacter sp. MIT 99-7217]